jgi:hypothetical protein
LLVFRSGGLADPCDEPLSHLWWLIGFIALGAVGSVIHPDRGWSLTGVCGVGFLIAATIIMLIEVNLGIAKHNLWPLSLMFTLLYGVAIAFIGACVGKIAVRLFGHHEG